ncbi:UbiA family prenyltransferase [candidate division TA06 bacterium]|nr:UbiA family prenyltransferase [candidate division TA06 bacterium]
MKYLRFIKFEHTLFSLPLIFSGTILARGFDLPLRTYLLILLAGIGARSLSLSLNRIIDRWIDQRNPRTKERELPSEKISFGEAWGVALSGLLLYLLSAFLIAPICLLFSPLPVLVFILYPYLKRFTLFSHFGVGLGLAMAPLGGWFAANSDLGIGIWELNFLPPILLGLFTLFWVSGFDIIYATLDEDFDRREELFSMPAVLGRKKALGISALLHILAFSALLVLYLFGLGEHMGSSLQIFFLLLVGFLLYWEHHKAHDVQLAFFKINAVLGFVVFLFVVSGTV